MKLSKLFKLRLPEKNGVDAADIADINTNFQTLEEGMQTFDFLADKYGFTVSEGSKDGNVMYMETVAFDCPVAATRETVESQSNGNDMYTTTIKIDGKTVTQTITVGDTTAEMVVGK